MSICTIVWLQRQCTNIILIHTQVTTISNHSPANIIFAITQPIEGHTYSSIITLADNIGYYPQIALFENNGDAEDALVALLLGTRHADYF